MTRMVPDAAAASRVSTTPRRRTKHDSGGGEDRLLPGLVERSGEGDRRAEDGAFRGRSGAVEKPAGRRVCAQLVEMPGAEKHEREGGAEGRP